jgi:mannose-6-phosphate isomerase-like protein (cupin superfamily)
LIKTEYRSAQPYVTKDGTVIRELMHPDVHGNRNQSLAEAELPAGARSHLHRHMQSEELYHILAGEGLMTVGGETMAVSAGDTVCIPPGAAHRIESVGSCALRFLCCASPAYRHDDTPLIEGPEGP